MAWRPAAASSSSTLVSVTSTVRRSELRPELSSAEAAAEAASPRRSWKTEQFTATCRSEGHRAACSQASDSTHAFNTVMWPWASAHGTEGVGWDRPARAITPSQQGLETEEASRGQVHRRLEHEGRRAVQAQIGRSSQGADTRSRRGHKGHVHSFDPTDHALRSKAWDFRP